MYMCIIFFTLDKHKFFTIFILHKNADKVRRRY